MCSDVYDYKYSHVQKRLYTNILKMKQSQYACRNRKQFLVIVTSMRTFVSRCKSWGCWMNLQSSSYNVYGNMVKTLCFFPELLELYFEKSWALPDSVIMIPDEQAAIVTFSDPEGLYLSLFDLMLSLSLIKTQFEDATSSAASLLQKMLYLAKGMSTPDGLQHLDFLTDAEPAAVILSDLGISKVLVELVIRSNYTCSSSFQGFRI